MLIVSRGLAANHHLSPGFGKPCEAALNMKKLRFPGFIILLYMQSIVLDKMASPHDKNNYNKQEIENLKSLLTFLFYSLRGQGSTSL